VLIHPDFVAKDRLPEVVHEEVLMVSDIWKYKTGGIAHSVPCIVNDSCLFVYKI
jgi:hypothetical protein